MQIENMNKQSPPIINKSHPLNNYPPQIIQNLLQQNALLKRQLSEFLSRQSSLRNQYSVNGTVGPSLQNFQSYRNSMQSSVDVRGNQFLFRGNGILPHKQEVTHRNVSNFQENIHKNNFEVVRPKRSYRHSVDICSNTEDDKVYVRNIHQQATFGPVQFQQKDYQYRLNQPLKSMQIKNSIGQQTQTNQLFESHKRQNLNIVSHQDGPSMQDQLYREKMMKLKGKKSPRSNRLSEEKHVVDSKTVRNESKMQVQQPILKTGKSQNSYQTMDERSQMMKAHQVLKEKLNKQEKSKLNNKMVETKMVASPLIRNGSYQNLIPKEKVQGQQSLFDESVQKENVLRTDARENRQDMVKKIPKFFPKRISKQYLVTQPASTTKQSILTQTEKNKNPSESKKFIDKNENNISTQPLPINIQQKQRQCRGNIYMEDELTKEKSRRSRRDSVEKGGNIGKNEVKKEEVKDVMKKRIQTVYSRVSYVNVNEGKREQVNRMKNIEMIPNIMKRNSNRVYLDQDQDNKAKITQKPQPNIQKSPSYPKIPSQQKTQIVSIEELHLIQANQSHEVNQPNLKSKIQKEKKRESNTFQVSMKRNQLSNQIYCDED